MLLRPIKEGLDDSRCSEVKNAMYNATTVTRFKSIMKYEEVASRPIAQPPCTEGVICDTEVTLLLSEQIWWRIEFTNDQGEQYCYLTNDFSLEPGELAFIYHQRWDEEKYFDNFKNDLGSHKAWGKSPVAIQQQATIGMMTYILTRLFLEDQFEELLLTDGDTTQAEKQKKKIEAYQKDGGIYLRAYWSKISKMPLQVWRFFKNCVSIQAKIINLMLDRFFNLFLELYYCLVLGVYCHHAAP